MSTPAERVLSRFERGSSALRLVARVQRASAWDGELIGENCRLRWDRHGWNLEELPQKGKKKLRVGRLDGLTNRGWTGFDAYIPENIMRFGGVKASDDYDQMKKKIQEAYDEAAKITLEGLQKKDPVSAKHYDWISKIKWGENQVHYLQVEPVDTKPFEAEGKDFTVKTSWTSFSAYDPKADFQSADPHYTQYASTSPTAARKFYLMLKADPTALKSVAWASFSDWLSKNKISYQTNFSQWT